MTSLFRSGRHPQKALLTMRRSLSLSGLFALLLAPAFLVAAVPARIQAIGTGRTELPNSVSARTVKATDLGEAPQGRRLTNVTLNFSLTTAQQTALTQLLIDQQNPASPRYHQWLTPKQFGALFGLSAGDLAKVTQWLTSQGLTVTEVAPSNNLVRFSGTVAQVEQALGTSIHTVTLNGEQHIANVTNPHLPSGVAAVVSGVTGLSDFRLKPRVRQSIVKAAAVKPDFTSGVSGINFLAPGDLNIIYDVKPLLSSSINGAGITIAVMGETDISIADVAAFRAASGLVANNPTVTVVGGVDPGVSTALNELLEAQLDVEWSGAMAPNAAVIFVNSTDVLNISLPDAITGQITTSSGAVPPIITISYGLCEQDLGNAQANVFNVLFQQANAQGQTIVGPAGDSGATDCDYQSATAADGLSVDFPASSPFVTGVGGTEFNEGSGTYWNGGIGNEVLNSAQSYIPEMVWNDSVTNGHLSAGGGGLSIFFSKPAWQVGTGVPNDFSRDVPDVAFSASSLHDPYLVCSSGSCVTGFRDSSGDLNTVGGTSVSTPVFAGLLALVEQKIGSRVGNANPVLYGLANSTYAASVFHDVTVGNNESACIQGSPNCPNGGSIGYTANVGYDLASGWGSVDTYNLATYWSQVTPTGTTSGIGSAITTTTLSSSAAICGISTGSIALNIQVAFGGGQPAPSATPGGSVQILVDNVPVGNAIALSNGTVSYTLNTSALTSGGHTVSATYTGDTNFAGSKGALPIDVVSPTAPDFSITPCSTSVQVVSGGTTNAITYTVNSFNGFTGAVAFSVSADASLTATYNFSVSPVTIAAGASTGTTVLTLTASETSSGSATGNTHQLSRSAGKGGGLASNRTFYTAGSGIAVASLLLLTLPRRRRWAALLAAVVSVSMLGALGCGSSSGTLLSSSSNATPVVTDAAPGTYNVTVTGIATSSTGTTLVHSAVLQFVVQ